MPVLAAIPPAVLAATSIAAAVASAGVGAYGAIESSEASSASAKYQAQVQANNSIIAQQNAQQATAAGEAQVTQSEFKTAAQIGAIKTNQAASGLDVNSGSDLDVQSSAKELGELDALTIRNQAARQAYGYQVQATSDTGQSQLSTASASQDLTAGAIGGVSSVIGGASSVSGKYLNYLQTGVVNPNVFGSNSSPGP
jgi:hypothetical protein